MFILSYLTHSYYSLTFTLFALIYSYLTSSSNLLFIEREMEMLCQNIFIHFIFVSLTEFSFLGPCFKGSN